MSKSPEEIKKIRQANYKIMMDKKYKQRYLFDINISHNDNAVIGSATGGEKQGDNKLSENENKK
jgi:hypothetical protein